VSLTVLQWKAHLNYILGAVIPTYMHRVSVAVMTKEDGVLPAGVRKLHLGPCRAHVWHFVRKERHGNTWVQYQAVGHLQFCWKCLMFTVFHFTAFCNLHIVSILGLFVCVCRRKLYVSDWLTDSLTHSIQQVLLEKLTGFQLVKKFPAFYGTRKFITTFTSAHHLSLSWASSIQSILHIPLPEDLS